MTASALDAVPGLGQARRTALLKHFGSLKKVRAASAAEIAEVSGFGPATAQAVVEALAGQTSPTPAVNVSTGEILDDDPALLATPAQASAVGEETS
jgi:excinuclease ABC subunit C